MLPYALVIMSTLVAPLRLEIVLPASVHIGESVPITVRLTNPRGKPVTIYLQGRPAAYDIVVSRTDGTVVWQRLRGATISSVLQVRKLGSGEVLEFKDCWHQRDDFGKAVPAGDYLVTAVLPADPPVELRTPAARLHILR